MDFFARQEQSRRTTRYLVLLFGLAFAAVALTTAIVLAVIFRFLPVADIPLLTTALDGGIVPAWEPLLATTGVVLLFMLVGSAGRSAMLSRGGASVARMVGGVEVRSDTTDTAHRRLINVVEEMAIAAGVPVPDVFVLEA
ncbi:MAG TPA: peptidase M48, partial [Gammaproteobacteria bacterium]|nr:peptidase M48 [Gammaproteobacteria bacterium]